MKTINEILSKLLREPKNPGWFLRHLVFLQVENSSLSPWDSPLTFSLFTVDSSLRVGVLGIRSLFLIILLYHLLLGIWIHLLFVISILLSRWFFEDEFLMRPTFPIIPNPQSFPNSPRSIRCLFFCSTYISFCDSACVWLTKCSCCSMIHDDSSQYFPNFNKLYVWITFGFCEGCRIFRKFFSVSCEILVWHGFHWVARTCTTIAYRWLFRDPRPSLRIVLCCFHFTNLFCPQNRSLMVFGGNKHEHFSSVFVPTFDASPSESEFALSEECASTCASKSSRLLWRAVTKQECLALALPCSSRLLFTVLRGLLVTSSRYWIWSWSQFSGIIWTDPLIWIFVDTLLLGFDDSLETTRGSELSTAQVIDFLFCVNRRVSSCSTHMQIHVFEQSLWSKRTAGVSSSSCTVASRSRSWTKTCAYSLICTVPGRDKSHMVLWTFPKYPLHLSSNSPCSALCIEAPEYTINIRASVSLALSQRIKRSLMFAFSLHIFSPNPRHFAGTICLSWGFLRWLFLRTRRARISLMRFTFWVNSSRLPLSFPNSILYQMHPQEFQVCPAEAFNPNSSIHWRWILRYTNLDVFFFHLRKATAPWIPFFDLALRLLLPSARRYKQR